MFENKDQLFNYLHNIRNVDKNAPPTKTDRAGMTKKTLRKVVKDVMSSPLLDDPETMQIVIMWVRTFFDRDFIVLVREHFDVLKNSELSLYKFFLLCGIRGEITQENFRNSLYQKKDKSDFYVIANHKSFSEDDALIVFLNIMP